MYALIVYDVLVERLDEVRKVLKRYLNWVQNSAFEGEISEGQLEELKIKVLKIIDTDHDSILVFTTSNPTWLKKMVLGREKGRTEEII